MTYMYRLQQVGWTDMKEYKGCYEGPKLWPSQLIRYDLHVSSSTSGLDRYEGI